MRARTVVPIAGGLVAVGLRASLQSPAVPGNFLATRRAAAA
jgi:hypothetical protein